MAPCQQMYGQPSGMQPTFPMTGAVIPGPGPLPGQMLPGVGNNTQQPPPPPHLGSSSPPSAAAATEPEEDTVEVSSDAREGSTGVTVEKDADKDSPDDGELSLSNIMLNMSLEEQTNIVGSYNGCKSSHRMAGLMGRENVFDACNGDPTLRGFPEDDFGSMCAPFDGIFDVSFGQETNLGLPENDRPKRASDLLASPS